MQEELGSNLKEILDEKRLKMISLIIIFLYLTPQYKSNFKQLKKNTSRC